MEGKQIFLNNSVEYYTEDGEVKTSKMMVISAPRPIDNSIRRKLRNMYTSFIRKQSMASIDMKEMSNERLVELQKMDERNKVAAEEKRKNMTPEEGSKADEAAARQAAQMIYSADPEHMNVEKFVDLFEEMLVGEKVGALAKIDDCVDLKQSALDNMDCEDRDLLLGYYVENFMMPCWM